jgi:hypothetical protein
MCQFQAYALSRAGLRLFLTLVLAAATKTYDPAQVISAHTLSQLACFFVFECVAVCAVLSDAVVGISANDIIFG